MKKILFATIIGALTVSVPAISSAASQGDFKVHTTTPGNYINVRSGTSTNTSIVTKVYDGTTVHAMCYLRGQTVTGKYGTSNVWDYIITPDGKRGYISDTYLYTGSDKPVIPDCNNI